MGWDDMLRQNIREAEGAGGVVVGELYFGDYKVLEVSAAYSVEMGESRVTVRDCVVGEFIRDFTTSLAPKHAISGVFNKYKRGMPWVAKLVAAMGAGRALFDMGFLEDELIRWSRHYTEILRELMKGWVSVDDMESLYRTVCRTVAGALKEPETEKRILAKLAESYKKLRMLWESYVRRLLDAVGLIHTVADALGTDPCLEELSKYMSAIAISAGIISAGSTT